MVLGLGEYRSSYCVPLREVVLFRVQLLESCLCACSVRYAHDLEPGVRLGGDQLPGSTFDVLIETRIEGIVALQRSVECPGEPV